MSERPRIWIPEGRIEAPHLVLSRTVEGEIAAPPVRVSGHFELELVHARTGDVTRRLSFSNLITNDGLNAIFTNASIPQLFSHCAVGTGNAVPQPGDATLTNPVRTSANGGTGDSPNYSAGPPEYWELVRTRLFGEGVANDNLKEIGFYNAASEGVLLNRQQILDANNEPTVLVKTAQEQLRVTFRLRCHIPGDGQGTITLSGLGTTHDYVARPIRTTNGFQLGWGSMVGYGPALDEANSVRAFEDNTLVGRTGGAPAGTGVVSNAGVAAAYTAGSFQRDYTYTWEPGYANFQSGIGSIQDFPATNYEPSRNIYQIAFTQKILKTDTRRLRLTMRRTLTAL